MSSNRDGLLALADGVRAYFDACARADVKKNKIPAEIVVGAVGLRERASKLNEAPDGGNRILFIEPDDGDMGTLSRSGMSHKGLPRVLLELGQPITLSVWSLDREAREDEYAQRVAAMNLLERTFQAMRRAVDPVTGQAIPFAAITFGKVRRVRQDVSSELSFGCELQVSLTLQTVFYDEEIPTVTPGVAIGKPANLSTVPERQPGLGPPAVQSTTPNAPS